MDLKSLFTPFPTLTTPRLLLRALRLNDLDDLYTYASDPEIDRYTPWVHYTSLDEARADLDEFITAYQKDGIGAFGIEHRIDQKLIGILTFSPPHPRNHRSEFGYTIARAYWGQGFATEAAAEFVRFAFEQMGLVRIEAVVLPDHIASARVLEKVGLQYEGLLHNYQVWSGVPCDLKIYAIVREVD
jgi:[ribosomal protein S5]-alanine N-acetyltransferase